MFEVTRPPGGGQLLALMLKPSSLFRTASASPVAEAERVFCHGHCHVQPPWHVHDGFALIDQTRHNMYTSKHLHPVRVYVTIFNAGRVDPTCIVQHFCVALLLTITAHGATHKLTYSLPMGICRWGGGDTASYLASHDRHSWQHQVGRP